MPPFGCRTNFRNLTGIPAPPGFRPCGFGSLTGGQDKNWNLSLLEHEALAGLTCARLQEKCRSTGVQSGDLVGLEGRPRDRSTTFPLQGLDAAALFQNLTDAGHRDSGFMQVL